MSIPAQDLFLKQLNGGMMRIQVSTLDFGGQKSARLKSTGLKNSMKMRVHGGLFSAFRLREQIPLSCIF